MKRYLILLLVVHCSLLATRAQVGEYRNDLAVGVSAGYMLSSVGFVPEVPQKQLGGMTGGVTFRYTCEKYFKSVCAIVAEVNLVQTGWKENIMDMDNQPVYYVNDKEKANPLSYERHMKYVQVPIMARLGWGRERKGLQGFIQLGPQIGFFLDESTTSNLQPGIGKLTERSSKIEAQDTMAVQKKFDYGIAVGGGIEFSHPKVGHFILEGRYYYGLGDIYKNSKSDFFGRSNFGQIVIKATYLFDLIRTKNDKIK
ncbi:Outer membrane protein beta-barrel domain-containing protein [Prevotella sp. tc2-28]|uniref:porin family protein n=1 Tax=Prevotella sp. tc2-28 TaxID=1761888 RepID=UPI00089A67CB|nr:Outer membrane protein beta-barrel domain-containing protein [Prevotella sp. tc2-28]